MKEKDIVEAGKLLCISSGEYSDHQIHGFFVVLKTFNHKKETLEFNSKYKNKEFRSRDDFLGMLVSKGYLLDVDYKELDLGYKGFDLETYLYQ